MIRASRALNDDFDNFRKVYDRNVTVNVADEEIQAIWQKERDSGGFAVNGELTEGHWQNQMELFYELNPELPKMSRGDVIAENFLARALEELGVQPGGDEPTR